MCDLCGDVLQIINDHDERVEGGVGLQLTKVEVLAVTKYVYAWQQRQCMCCYKDGKNFEKFNNIIQVILNLSVNLVHSLSAKKGQDNESTEHNKDTPLTEKNAEQSKEDKTENNQTSDDNSSEKVKESGDNAKMEMSTSEEPSEVKEQSSSEKNVEEVKDGEGVSKTSEQEVDLGGGDKPKEKSSGSEDQNELADKKDDTGRKLAKDDHWTLEEKDMVFQFVSKVFLMNLPLYMAYKHLVHASLEELSPQETSALSNYCELSDPEIPVFLLRNVCFYCDSNGVTAIAQCFDEADPGTLPCAVAHTLINIIANLRLWMNIQIVMQHIVPLKSSVIRYMCRLSDKDLRLAGTRNTTDLMWAAVKEPLDTQVAFDREGMELAFKYFTCSTLTIRLAGITQINNQINMYNELANSDSLLEAESISGHLADWLTENKIIEHIFGPNLHVELIKQSQLILNFLGVEGRISNEHVDCIWAAGQLKHCGKQVHDVMIPLIKNIEIGPAQHLLKLVSRLEPATHTEQTLYLASALIKYVWNIVCNHSHAASSRQNLPSHTHNLSSLIPDLGGLDNEVSSSCEQSPQAERTGLGYGERLCLHSHMSSHSEQLVPSNLDIHRHAIQEQSEGEESANTSLVANSDFSNISDDTLPTDISEHEAECSRQMARKKRAEDWQHLPPSMAHKHSHNTHRHHHHRHESDTSGDEEPIPMHKRHELKRVKHIGRVVQVEEEEDDEDEEEDSSEDGEDGDDEDEEEEEDEDDEEEEDEEDDEDDEEEDEEVAKHMKVESLNSRNEALLGHMQELSSDEALEKAYLHYREKGMSPEQLDNYLQHLHATTAARRQGIIPTEILEDMASPEEGSCNSSHASNKSEKNVADFDGEDGLSEEELAHLSEQARHSHRQHFSDSHIHHHHHLASMASLCHKPTVGIHQHQKVCIQDDVCRTFSFQDVCKPGQTLLWDLIQEDKANKLPEGLLGETEKVLCDLVCFSTDRRIRSKFIEACVDNLKNHRSAVISLRLLPKLFASFQQYRSGFDTHSITMYAARELGMMRHFFNDLIHYTKVGRKNKQQQSLYSYKEGIQVRLQFLTSIFSSAGTPENCQLSMEQMDILWNCLATDSECGDDCYSWFLQQARSKELHAMSMDTFAHIFYHKIPQLNPEGMSMMGLNLFTHLCSMARLADVSTQNAEEQHYGMDQMWGIALRAHNTDVSLTAINFLNNHYIHWHKETEEKEKEFVQTCMESLVNASSDLQETSDSSLLVIRRGLILLTNHLESYRKRYAFHLRNWQLDGKGITSHQKSLQDKNSTPLRLVLQPAGATEKTTIEMLSTDLVAELRAEVSRWYENMQKVHQQKQQQMQQQQQAGGRGSLLTPILGAMLGDGPIRLITGGQELPPDIDDKSLAEMQFKDHQIIYVSLGANRGQRKVEVGSSTVAAPSRKHLPMMLLLAEPHFSRLFQLLQQLSTFKPGEIPEDLQERHCLQMKARVLSRKVWDLLMLLPTNPEMLQKFEELQTACKAQKKDDNINWELLLDPCNPHKLMYSLQIVESLSRTPLHRRRTMSQGDMGWPLSGSDDLSASGSAEEQRPEEVWTKEFVNCGGLKHLFQIFLSGSLQTKDGDHWNEWLQDCLAYLLRLLTQFALQQPDDCCDNQDSPKKKLKKQKTTEKIVIPTVNPEILSMVEVENVIEILMAITYDAALPSQENHNWSSASWGRVEVCKYALSFLVCLMLSCTEAQTLCTNEHLLPWLKRLTLQAPEPSIRHEACQGLYRACKGTTMEGLSGYSYLLPILASLLSFLKEAQNMKCAKKKSQEEKEPYGPGCRDYFWLVCGLTDKISHDDAVASWEQGETAVVNLNSLAIMVSSYIESRPYLERTYSCEEDDGLIGLLSLCISILQHNPPFKISTEGQNFLKDIFNCLFALPSPKQRLLPKCKSQSSRSAAFDLLVEMTKGSVENYAALHELLLQQHTKDSHAAYSWDNWPREEERARCGYVGLTNLGATCYMATCMQHLYMIPEARKSVLEAPCMKLHVGTLQELKKMFAYLMESERKAYNPRSFCKVYTMDHQPLNTGEQKDMTEFFTDLISKMEDMGQELRLLVKDLFGGILTNNVVSLDCHHVSRTKEEFYTIRCQVADMKNLFESLDEVTVKDMLEGDNMYTCSKCQKKVRAEKRACFKRLPKILCFNTMRYTFNMVTMMKEKVNTHFSFPLQLDMSPYMEKNLIGKERLQADEDVKQKEAEEAHEQEEQSYEYELIGVTVHTGTADGGHYYSFIRDKLHKSELGHDKWYLFNDAEVKPFDHCQIAAECFGGEMTSKTYDTATEKFMDFSFEKTNSAYMLFYERLPLDRGDTKQEIETQQECEDETTPKLNIELTTDLAEWIWEDNMQFLRDKNIFEHTYFQFIWQMCAYIPTTLSLSKDQSEISIPLLAVKLGASFVLETLIHAKEKPTMYHWIELLTKQFNACHAACEWFLDTMAEDDWWPQQILIKCPNQMVRQMFQRLVIHVINQLKPIHTGWYIHPLSENDGTVEVAQIGNKSCVTRFVKKMLGIIDHSARLHCKYLTEYFAFLLEFARMGENECYFLLHINAITTMINFFMGHKSQENYVEIVSEDDDEEDDDIITLTDDKYRPQSLEKMVTLIAKLTERSRDNKQLTLSDKDYHAILGGKGFPFLYHQIRDNINLQQTCNLIFSLCRWNERLAVAIVQMIFSAISRLGVESQAFFKLLSLLVEIPGGPPGLPPFTNYVSQKIWEVLDYCPHQCLDWLATQASRNKLVRSWVLQKMDVWVEPYLLAYSNPRVRNAAAYLLVSLVPSEHFRQAFPTSRHVLSPLKDNIPMNQESLSVLHDVYNYLLRLMERVKQYADANTHGTNKLVAYFTVLSYCVVSRAEKVMFSRYFMDLWQVFQPKLSEPPISIFHNKQALLIFWHKVCLDCAENVRLIITNSLVTKHIAFNYILADHEDQEVVLFNRAMLPAYYGILRMCCQESPAFTRQLAHHTNIQWAFQNITPYPAQYTAAVEELFRILQLMAKRQPDMSEDELKSVAVFRRTTIQLYLQKVEPRQAWQSIINALKVLVETTEDRLLVLSLQGLPVLHEAMNTLHLMHHEATACHVAGDIVDLLSLMLAGLKTARQHIQDKKEVKQHLYGWKDRMEFCRKLLTLLNSYTPAEIRSLCLDVLREMVLDYQDECLQTIVPYLLECHHNFQESNMPVSLGPYFPKRGQRVLLHKTNIRPPRPQFLMFLHSNQLEASRGVDEAYDAALIEFFSPYHLFVDLLMRVAANHQNVTQSVVNLSAMVAYEGVPLHMPYFAKLWCEIYQSEHMDKRCISALCNCSSFIDYVDAVLLDERQSLNNPHINQFFCNFFPKVYGQVLNDQGQNLLDNLVDSLSASRQSLQDVDSDRQLDKLIYRINGDLRAWLLLFSVHGPRELSSELMESLQYIQQVCQSVQQQRASPPQTSPQPSQSKSPRDRPKPSADEGEVPTKRRKTSSSEGEASDSSTKPKKSPAETESNPYFEPHSPPESPSVADKTPPDVKKVDMQADKSSEKHSDQPSVQTESSSQKTPECKEVKDVSNEESVEKSKESDTGEKPSTSQEMGTKEKAMDVDSTVDVESQKVGSVVSEHSDSGSDGQTDSVTDGKSGQKKKQSKRTDAHQAARSQGAIRLHTRKERPTTVDLVVRNIEMIFSMLKK